MFGLGALADPDAAAAIASAHNTGSARSGWTTTGAFAAPWWSPRTTCNSRPTEIERMADRAGVVQVFLPLNER